MILIGSRALAIRAPFLLKRSPRDFDFIAHEEEALDFLEAHDLKNIERVEGPPFKKIIYPEQDCPCEFEIIEEGKSASLFEDLVKKDPKTISTDFGLIPNVNLLFTLKASHRFFKNSPHFWKTAKDYHIMKDSGCLILPEYQEFYKFRTSETYFYKHPKLNVKKADFFNHDQVVYVYDHDSIHEAMKLQDKPAYTYYQKDGSEVDCDKEKFFAQTDELKLHAVLEESYVLALERSQITYGDEISPRQSFLMALSKVCSSITSGWFRTYAYDHIFEALKAYDDTYVDRFKQAIVNGVVIKL